MVDQSKPWPGSQNLIKFGHGRDPREAGRKSGESRRKKARERMLMRDVAAAILALPMKEGELSEVESIEEMQKLAAEKNLNLTVQEMGLFTAAAKGVAGDVKALEFVRDTAGQKPIEQIKEIDTEDASNAIDALIAGLSPIGIGTNEQPTRASNPATLS